MSAKPLIKFEIEDKDIMVHCSNGHEMFELILKVRLMGASVVRVARCVACGEEEELDER